MPNQIYDRFDPSLNYERHLFRADKVLQSAELIEIQRSIQHRVKDIADVLFKDGDVVRDARIVVNAETGDTLCEAGAIYLAGAVRGVPPANFVIPVVGVVTVGVYLREAIITELQDPSLVSPAVGTRGYMEPGAARLQILPQWGVAGGAGAFYPVYTVEDGHVRAKEPPPQLDAVTQALARYDRDSAGGSYVVQGLQVAMAADLPDGRQVYTVAEGRARVSGYGVELTTSRRLVYDAQPDLQFIDSEPHASTTAAAQRINMDRSPLSSIESVKITAERTVNINHGGFAGALDPLPDNSVLVIKEVKQGATVYAKDADWKLTAGQVDWSPSGAEPAPGSTYSVRYEYIATVEPTAVDATGCTVTGAVPGSLILVSYHQMLPRVDRLCLDAEGGFIWLRGVASAWRPTAPAVPAGLLPIASVAQTWTSARSVTNNGVRVVPMNELAAITSRIDLLTELMAQQRLESDAGLREAGTKKGLFVDPFTGDEQRDQGLAQTAAIVDGELTLPIVSADVLTPTAALAAPATLPLALQASLGQALRTGSMPVNPYRAFDLLPASVLLKPAVDQWTNVQTNWLSPITQLVSAGASTSTDQLVSISQRAVENLRQIVVHFEARGFGAGENVSALTFDGIDVSGAPLVANGQGLVAGQFTIPAGIRAGAKRFSIEGQGGTRGEATFTGSGLLRIETRQIVTTVASRPIDPLAQTFTPADFMQLAAVDLWFTAKGTSRVLVQIREVQLGVPTRTVLGETQLEPAGIQLAGASTRVTFSRPVPLEAGTEYALVVLCDDATTALSLAELGKFDATAQAFYTQQGFNVGVLLSSANASTWTPHQDKDLTFRLHAARCTSLQRLVELGQCEVAGATDLLLLSLIEAPTAAARVDYTLALPDGSHVTVADGQPLRLAAPITGQVGITARLVGAERVTPVLHPGLQLVAATVSNVGDYFSRAINAGNNSRVRIIFDALLPGGSAVVADVASAAADASLPASWTNAANVKAAPIGDGWMEMQHELANISAAAVRLRLRLSGNTAARPRVRNLRVIVL